MSVTSGDDNMSTAERVLVKRASMLTLHSNDECQLAEHATAPQLELINAA